MRNSQQGIQIETILNGDNEQIFTGIGQIRISTLDPQPGLVIISVSFMYDPSDKAFAEELVLRVKELRGIIQNYFCSFSALELQKQADESLKTELLQRFNSILRLGQIEKIYFSDYMIIF
jgi:flagellar basal body-associated protein FliL